MSMGRRRPPLVTALGWILSAALFLYIFYHNDSPSRSALRNGSPLRELYPSDDGQIPGTATPPSHLPVPETPPLPPQLSAPTEKVMTKGVKKDNSTFGPWSSFEKLFFFGDSYTATNFDVWGPGPAPERPLGNYQGKEQPNPKPTWPVFLTSTHNASVVLTYNLAVGGSTVNRSIAKPYILGSDFEAETDVFLDHYAHDAKYKKADWDADTSLFFVWFGINDLILEWYNEYPKELQFVPEFLSYRNSFDKLYTAGARKFLFLTVPPAYRSVDFVPDVLLTIAEDTALFNSRLFEMRTELAAAYTDATFAVFDAHSFWARVIENPKEFEETKGVLFPKAVCEEPDPEEEAAQAAAALGQNGDVQLAKRSKADDVMEQLIARKDDGPKDEWQECYDGIPMLKHLWTKMHGTAVIHNATAARIVKDCLGPEGKIGYCF